MSKSRLILLLCVALAGCSAVQEKMVGDHTNDYQKQSHTIPEIKPEVVSHGEEVTGEKYDDFYPVSGVKNSQQSAEEPSVLPPESKIAQSLETSADEAPHQVQSKLNLLVPSDKAWGIVGAAIQKAGYEVLDQDKLLQVYYVLDTSKTSGKINPTSPIYQIQLSSSASGSEIVLLDEQNKPLSTEDGSKVLTTLRQHLTQVAS